MEVQYTQPDKPAEKAAQSASPDENSDMSGGTTFVATKSRPPRLADDVGLILVPVFQADGTPCVSLRPLKSNISLGNFVNSFNVALGPGSFVIVECKLIISK